MSTPNRPPARRRMRADSAGPFRSSGLLGLMVVALTAGMLALAGTTPRGIGAPVGTVSRVDLESRTFVCDAALPGSSVRRGSVAQQQAAAPSGTAPFVLDVSRDQATDAFAGEQAASGKWSAWQQCPEPRARWWFTGAGGAAVTHDTELYVTNPRTGAAVLDIDVFGPGGAVEAPALHGVTVAGGATRRLDLAKVAPAVGELAVRVLARRGLVTVSAADSFSPGAIGKEVREWLPSTSLPAGAITLAGMPVKPDNATLVLANAGNSEAIAQVEVIGARGAFTPEGVEPVTIAPQSVASISLRQVFDGTAQAIRVTSEQKISASLRTTDSGDIAYAAAVGPIRGRTALAVPAGKSRKLVLTSLGKAGELTVTGFDARGGEVLTKSVAVAADTTVAVNLPKTAVSLMLASARGTTAGAIIASGTQGVMTAGVTSAIRSIRLPVVRPAW